MNLPQGRQEALQWFESRIATWTTNALSIGLTAPSMTSFSALITSNRKDFNDMQAARNAAKAATQKFYTSATALRNPGTGYIAAIKAYAESTGNPHVYDLGMIDPPAPPTPVPAPTAPFDLLGDVSPTGLVTVSWNAKVSGPSSGIFFMVQRQRSGETGWTILGGTQEKSFVDPAAHLTSGSVTYQVRAQRGTDASDWSMPIVFNLAAGPGLEETAGFVGGSEGPVAAAA